MRERITSVIIVLILPALLFAATTGKIAGTVTDAQSGENLPGVNVIVEGTTMGAATDLNGNYFILNVPPGTYTIKASLIGYTVVSKPEVRVAIDRTSTVDFNIQQTTIEGQEVTIVAERPKIRADVANSQQNFSSEDVAAIPSSPDVRDLIATSVGVGRDQYGFLNMRGGAIDEVGVYVDGFNNNDARLGWAQVNVPKSSIKEVQILKGGFNAEYGRVRSGLINMITKEGGSDYSFNIDTRMSPGAKKHFGSNIFSADNYWFVGRYLSLDPTGDRNGDGNVDFEGWKQVLADNGGEFKFNTPGIGEQTITSAEDALAVWKHQHPFFEYGDQPDTYLDGSFSGPVPFTDGKTTFSFSGYADQAYYFRPFVRDNSLDWKTGLKITHRLSSDMTVRLNANYNEIKGVSPGFIRNAPARNDMPDPRSWVSGHYIEQQQLASASMDRTSMYSFDSIYKKTNFYRSDFGLDFTHVLNNASFYEVKMQYDHTHSLASPGDLANLEQVVATVGDIQLNEMPNDFYGIPAPDMLGVHRLSEDNGRRDNSTYGTFQADIDYTNQFNYFNQIKMGAGLIVSNQDLMYGIDLWRNNPGLRFLRWVNREFTFYEAEFYIQDKIEFEGMVMNIGLRGDYFKTDEPLFTERFSKYYTKDLNYDSLYAAPSTEPGAKFELSPRLGIAHPISENSKLYFNYGYFYQRPEVYQISHNFQRKRRYSTALSNSDLLFRKTIAYELGYEQNIAGWLDVTLSGYYRDVTRNIANVGYRGNDPDYGRIAYSRPENSGYQDVKGVELVIDFPYNKYVKGFVNYNYMLASSGRYGYSTIYQDPNAQDQRVSANINEAKARPTLKTNIKFVYPEYSGSSMLGKIFSDASLTTLFRWNSGAWLTYHSENYPGLEENNIQWNSTYNLDLEISKGFRLLGTTYVRAYVQIQNALNSKFLHSENGLGWGGGGLNVLNRNVYLDMVAEEGVDPGTYEGNGRVEDYLDQAMYWNLFNAPRDIWFGLRISLD
ncbi:TonB-dependent receptor plug domain-containing protein [candidate division KSB1 bacterium]|nr:TonB-dependent receptor plug domain-containing protein [candidate division KSB1 bacterium]